MALALVASATAVPPDVWAPLLVLAVCLVAMLLLTVLPFAVPVLVVAWMLRNLTRAARHGTPCAVAAFERAPPRTCAGSRRALKVEGAMMAVGPAKQAVRREDRAPRLPGHRHAAHLATF